MNLFKYHTNPKSLRNYDKAHETVLELIWDHVKAGKRLNPTQITIIASDPRRAYQYAKKIIKGRFPEGEKAIASNPASSYWYARDVIGGRFIKGEETVASDDMVTHWYETEFNISLGD